MLIKTSVSEFRILDKIYLVIDETYFPNDICLVIYCNLHVRLTQLYSISDVKDFKKITEDLQNILNFGIKIKIKNGFFKAILDYR